MSTPFKAIKISERIFWVGAIDWELRDFHGYSTSRGTTYNAYLIMGEKPILIDTVKAPFFNEMLARISSVVDPKQIRYLISNHSEMDHSGAMDQAIATIKPKQVFASKNGVLALKEHFHWDREITAITHGQTLELGDVKLQCFETKMLHWPDSMFTYLVNDGVLFSQDDFGMHFATSKLLVAENDPGIVHHESGKYFANILLPFTNFVSKMLTDLPRVPLKFIAPDHGPIWQGQECQTIIKHWHTWAEQKSYPKVVIIYDTMWGSTAKMAKAIADGCQTENVMVKVLPLRNSHRSDVATEILEAGALIIGSPVLNQQLFPTLADTLTYLKGLKRQNLIGQYFGSYGWSSLALNQLEQELQLLAIKAVGQPVLAKYVPDAAILVKCKALGQAIAKTIKTKN